MIRILYSTGLLLIILSCWLYYDSLPPPLCMITEPEREMYEIVADSDHQLLFTLTNPTNQIVRIVGLAECCDLNARFRAKREPPFEIPPKSTYDIACTLQVFQPGEFSGQIHCYLADPHLREIVLKVSGTVKK